MSSRGIRNHNWGNLRHGNNWKGEVKGKDKGFETFENPIWGLRAIIILARSYYKRHNIRTIKQFIHRYAPPSDNNNHNANYVEWISVRAGREFKPYDKECMRVFVKALCQFENGQKELDKVWQDWYFDMAWKLE